jgi:SAM-dependent methyltransferase
MPDMTRAPTERFSDRVADYVRYRPRYPAAVLDALREAVGLAHPWVIADVGSGTGFSAEPFIIAGHEVFAVEPNAAMRGAAESLLGGYPGFHSVVGTAEATTLPAASVDLVIAGQAFHWFDAAAARRECARILRGERWAALLWNTRQTDTTPFLRAYDELLRTHGTDYSAVRHDRHDPADLARFFGGPYERRVLGNEQVFDFESLSGRLRSSSYVPARGAAGHDAMMAMLRDIFDAHSNGGVVRMPYDLEVYTGRVRPHTGE